jgi:hypothetical protein
MAFSLSLFGSYATLSGAKIGAVAGVDHSGAEKFERVVQVQKGLKYGSLTIRQRERIGPVGPVESRDAERAVGENASSSRNVEPGFKSPAARRVPSSSSWPT